MSKFRLTNSGQGNKIAALLESGKSLKNRIGWVKVADGDTYFEEDQLTCKTPIYGKVKALGLVSDKCGIKIRTVLVGGTGELVISPSQWIDTLPEVKRLTDVARRKEIATKTYKKIKNNHFRRTVIDQTHKLFLQLKPWDRSLLQDEHHKEDSDPPFFKKDDKGKFEVRLSLSTSNALAFARKVCLLWQGLAPDESPDSYEWRD